MSENSKYDLKVIDSLDEIPDFKSEDEEREWWAEHEMSDELWDSLPDMTPELDQIAPLLTPLDAESTLRVNRTSPLAPALLPSARTMDICSPLTPSSS